MHIIAVETKYKIRDQDQVLRAQREGAQCRECGKAS